MGNGVTAAELHELAQVIRVAGVAATIVLVVLVIGGAILWRHVKANGDLAAQKAANEHVERIAALGQRRHAETRDIIMAEIRTQVSPVLTRVGAVEEDLQQLGEQVAGLEHQVVEVDAAIQSRPCISTGYCPIAEAPAPSPAPPNGRRSRARLASEPS